MTLKTFFLSTFCLFFLASCAQTPPLTDTTDHAGALHIVTNSSPLTIHAKKIAGSLALVDTFPELGVSKISPDQQKILGEADIAITQNVSDTFTLNTVSQVFEGIHLSLIDNSHDQIIAPLSETLANIKTFRDTFARADASHRGDYFDRAGNYENLLQETYKKLQQRINEYNKKPFLIFGSHMGVFLEEFGLSQYIAGTFAQTLAKQPEETLIEIQDIVSDKNITIAFVENGTDARILDLLQSRGVVLYPVGSIDDDTSEWGYIRYIEKVVNTFVSAFNAYD